MKPERTITCEDCGGDYRTIRDNTKRCAVCRLIRDLAYVGDTRADCRICDETFAPIARGETICGSCQYQPKRHGNTECAFCHENKLQVAIDVAVCHDCARDPKLRDMFRKSLRRKVKSRMEAVHA